MAGTTAVSPGRRCERGRSPPGGVALAGHVMCEVDASGGRRWPAPPAWLSRPPARLPEPQGAPLRTSSGQGAPERGASPLLPTAPQHTSVRVCSVSLPSGATVTSRRAGPPSVKAADPLGAAVTTYDSPSSAEAAFRSAPISLPAGGGPAPASPGTVRGGATAAPAPRSQNTHVRARQAKAQARIRI